MKNFDNRLEKLRKLINDSEKTVFFGGAGVSTESGVPDFRSKDGLYNQRDIRFEKYSPEYLLSSECLYSEPKVFYEFYRQKLDCRTIKPNITHKVLARLEKQGKLTAVITQNIDGLHQKAGSVNVCEIHGTTMRNYCTGCKREYPSEYIFDCKQEIPRCECGHGIIRPDVTLYGESLPAQAWEDGAKALREADLLIIGGTSGTVYPANTMVRFFGGKNIVIINRDKTDFENQAQLVFHENLGEIFSKL